MAVKVKVEKKIDDMDRYYDINGNIRDKITSNDVILLPLIINLDWKSSRIIARAIINGTLIGKEQEWLALYERVFRKKPNNKDIKTVIAEIKEAYNNNNE